ncbi:hypothetical protein SAMN05216338_1001326 [Bradyrhizobium sp. Rc2d]|nr:hypothetical protein SAMN05216338_1001326 [Bradyrhizobium sp. Rc2d]
MQLHHANTLERIAPVADQGSGEVAWPVTLDQSDFSTSNRDEILALLEPSRHPKRTTWLVVAALAGGFGLGWAGAWYGPAAISALKPIAQVETASRRIPDTKPGAKAESARKIASASGSRTPPGLSQHSTVSASVAPKSPAKAASAAQSAEASNLGSSAVEADMSVTGSLGSAGAAPVSPRDKADDYCGLGSPRGSRRNGRARRAGCDSNGSTGRCGPRHRTNRLHRALGQSLDSCYSKWIDLDALGGG